MSRRKVFHTAEEALECKFSKEIESDIIALLPDVDELTDEVYFDDDEMTIPSVKYLSEFVTWKEEENKTMSKYIRQRGCKTLQNGEIVMNYHCCRSGTYKSKGNGLKN
ncbi:uncharacterized protein TNCV_1290681 [Trichonephila clavipes]|nr:uncharacterized protein TNCV_1290681 [Trichonephila clavipes]